MELGYYIVNNKVYIFHFVQWSVIVDVAHRGWDVMAILQNRDY